MHSKELGFFQNDYNAILTLLYFQDNKNKEQTSTETLLGPKENSLSNYKEL